VGREQVTGESGETCFDLLVGREEQMLQRKCRESFAIAVPAFSLIPKRSRSNTACVTQANFFDLCFGTKNLTFVNAIYTHASSLEQFVKLIARKQLTARIIAILSHCRLEFADHKGTAFLSRAGADFDEDSTNADHYLLTHAYPILFVVSFRLLQQNNKSNSRGFVLTAN
jgi:hypothetical protein